ncbi:MAG: hypothetical protein GX837_10760 [Methanomicrobiales archaeon]|jgi:hypothetical protein|nr:hypothetical protein [Methanomicrobiales archaeon]
MPELAVGSGCWVDGRCIIPIVRVFVMRHGGAVMASLTPVALVIIEGEREYLTILPGAPQETEDALETLRDDIEREKEKCEGKSPHHS